MNDIWFGPCCIPDDFPTLGTIELQYPDPTGFATVHFIFHFTYYDLANVVQYTSGLTLGGYFHMEDYWLDGDVCEYIYKVHIRGVLYYSLFINGVGTFYQRNRELRAIFPCSGQFEILEER